MNIKIDSKLHQQLRLEAFDKHIPLQELVDEILQQHTVTQGA